MDQRLGDLAQEFKDLVYPAHYNPDSKPAPKRKTGEASVGTVGSVDFAIKKWS